MRKLPPEIEKIRDENIEKQGRTDLYCRTCYIDGFNEAFHLGRKFERDELAKRAPEFDLDKLTDKFLAWQLPESVCSDLCVTQKQIGRYGTNLLTFNEAKEMILHLLSEHQQTSLHYEAKIAKLEESYKICCAAEANFAKRNVELHDKLAKLGDEIERLKNEIQRR